MKPAGASSESGRRRRQNQRRICTEYCKPAEVNVENLILSKGAGASVLHWQASKRRFKNLLVSTGKITRAELREETEIVLATSSTATSGRRLMPTFWRAAFRLTVRVPTGKTEVAQHLVRKVRGSRFLNILQSESTRSSAQSCCRSSMESLPGKGTGFAGSGERTHPRRMPIRPTRCRKMRCLKKRLSFHDSRMSNANLLRRDI